MRVWSRVVSRRARAVRLVGAGLVAAGLVGAGVVGMGLLGAGCAPRAAVPDALDGPVDASLWSAFAPVSVRVDSLTRVEEGPGGRPRLVVYFQLLDAWGDSTKSPGWLQVELYGVRGVSAEREQRWELDLTDPVRNSAFFDVTGLYRVPLEEAPAWLLRPDAPDRPRAMRLRLFYRTVGPAQTMIDLRDTFERSV